MARVTKLTSQLSCLAIFVAACIPTKGESTSATQGGSTGNTSTVSTTGTDVCSGVYDGDLLVAESTDIDTLVGIGSVTGNLQIYMKGKEVEDLSFLACLQSVGGDIVISRNDNLVSTAGPTMLSSYGSLMISRNPQLREVSGFGGSPKIADLWLYDNPLLENVQLAGAEEIGLMRIGQCNGDKPWAHHLALEALEGFSNLKGVDTVFVEGNESLVSLGFLESIVENGGTPPRAAVVRRNPKLSQAEVVSQLSALGVEIVDVCGNAGWIGEEDECICIIGE